MTVPDRCTCTIVRETGPDPVDDAEQDPFCLVHPAPLEVLLGWLADWHVARTEPPGPAELVRLCVIVARYGAFAVPGDSRDAGITNDRLGLVSDLAADRLAEAVSPGREARYAALLDTGEDLLA